MLVRSLVAQHGDDRLMIVFPASNVDSRGLSRRRIAAIGGHKQRRLELAAVLERDHDTRLAAIDLATAGFPQKPYVFAGLGALLQAPREGGGSRA